MGSRRSTSSADTSIDEDTADQLLADDFIVPATPLGSRPGTMSYARPTSAAFEPQRRTPSFASSQGLQAVLPRLARPSRSSLTSVSPRPSLPSIISPSEAQTADLGNTESAVPSVYGSESNPFNDPPDLGSITPLGEKPTALDTFSPVADKELSAWAPEPVEPVPQGNSSKRRRLLCIVVPVAFLLLAIVLIPVGLLVIKPNVSGHGSTNGPSNTPNMSDPASFGVPPAAIGTVLDSTKWLDWTDFNLTYTNAMVGGLSVMVRLSDFNFADSEQGLNSTWDDSVQANSNVPPLSSAFPYGQQPIKGISIGGWLILEVSSSPYKTDHLAIYHPLNVFLVPHFSGHCR